MDADFLVNTCKVVQFALSCVAQSVNVWGIRHKMGRGGLASSQENSILLGEKPPKDRPYPQRRACAGGRADL